MSQRSFHSAFGDLVKGLRWSDRGCAFCCFSPSAVGVEGQARSGSRSWPALWPVTERQATRDASGAGLVSKHTACTLGTGLGCMFVKFI